MSYTEEVYERVVAQNPGEPEFHQAVKEVLDSLKVVIDRNEEKYRSLSILERLVEPERIISFRVPWVDDLKRCEGSRKGIYRGNQDAFIYASLFQCTGAGNRSDSSWRLPECD